MEALYETLRSIGYTHPLHPPMTYLPLGMVIGSLLFSLISVFPRCGKLAVTARHCITLGFVGVFPTMLLGYLDWQYFYGGRLILPIQMKLILAAVLTLMLSLTVVLYWKLPVSLSQSEGLENFKSRLRQRQREKHAVMRFSPFLMTKYD